MMHQIAWIILKLVAVCIGHVLFKWSQAFIKNRTLCVPYEGRNAIQHNDLLLELTKPINLILQNNWVLTQWVLTLSSVVIDVFDIVTFVLFVAFDVWRPIMQLALVLTLRQIMQSICALPLTDGIIWRNPKIIPSMTTYDVPNDFFFSCHTATTVLAGLWLSNFGIYGIFSGICLIIFEILTILSLRVHYTMDIYAGVMTSIAVYCIL